MKSDMWTIRLGKQAELITPAGDTVPGLPHKVMALVAVLALLAPEPIARTTLGEIFWPSASASRRQVCLRQAIRTLRRETGEDPFFEAGRQALCLKSDRVRVELEPTTDLLRQFPEPWFVLFRSSELAARQFALGTLQTERETSTVRSLEEVLEWTAQNQPNQAYGLIRHTIDLGTSLPPHRALALSKEVLLHGAINHPMRGWANMLHAYALFILVEVQQAREEFHDLRVVARRNGDAELLAISAFFESNCLVYMGALEEADAVLAQVQSIKSHRFTPRASSRLLHGKGLVASCRGDYATGFGFLLQAIQVGRQSGETYERMYAGSNMAWISASVGDSKTARAALTDLSSLDDTDHWRFQLTKDLARLHLACSDGNPEEVIMLGEIGLSRASRMRSPGFETYFYEGLGRCHTLLNNQKQARNAIEAAARIRKSIAWPILPWDTDRLKLAHADHRITSDLRQ